MGNNSNMSPEMRAKCNANLRSFRDMTPEERRAIGSKGGKKRAENTAYNKTFAEALKWALDLPAVKGNPTVDLIRKKYPGLTNRDAVAIGAVYETINGNMKGFELIRDTVGENPNAGSGLAAEGITIRIETVGN